MNDDIIETELDQALDLNVDLSWVDNTVLDYVAKADIQSATNMVLEIKRTQQVAGMSTALILYYLDKYWERFEIDMSCKDYIYEKTGYHLHTIDRYCKIGKLLREEAPEHLRSALENKTLNQLAPIANAVAQGYEIVDETWKELADAEDAQIVREIIRDDVREAAPRSNSIRLWVDRSGSIWAYSNNERSFIGSLEVDNDDPVVQKAIERIIKNSGMLKDE